MTGPDDQRVLVQQVRREILERERGRPGSSVEPPIRIMARIVTELERACADLHLDPEAVRLEIVNRTIGDVDLRRVTECEGAPGGPGDYRLLADELGIALPGEELNGTTASGTTYRWLRDQMTEAERQLLATGYDPRIYDVQGVGNLVLREWLAADMAPWGLDVSAANVALGLGATDCIDKVLRGFAYLAPVRSEAPGAVLFAAPGFNIPELQASSYGYRLHSVRTRPEDDFKLTAELLAQELEEGPDITVVYLTITSNPTTFAYTPEQLQAITAVLRRVRDEGRRVHVVADLAYIGTGPPAADRARMQALSADPVLADRIIYVSSLSKTHTLTGERFGWVTFGDAAFATAMGASWTNSIGCLPGEWQLRFMAYHRLFRQHPGLVAKIRSLYALRRTRLREQLQQLDEQHHLFDRIYPDDDATIYSWCKLREGEDCFSVFETTGIAGIPGSTFGYTDQYVRFSVGLLPIATDRRSAALPG
jgi:aspartate/methionine/tyrosine aminotransferase